jgi:hypothetical protein
MKYITFTTIGESGNLGSQLQQYASLYAIAKKTNRNIIFPESSLNLGFGFKFAELLNIPINTKPDDFFHDFDYYRPNDRLILDNNVFNLNPNLNFNIINRFDLFYYWYPDYSKDILEWEWNKEYKNQADEIYNMIKTEGKELVSLHVRRGDYLLPQHDHFCQLDVNYYEEALQPFIKEIDKYQFVIFSNDIEWCKSNLIEGDSVTFIEPSIDYVDLILMSMCDHNIIANSSYSWWAAFKNKNKNKKIYCPENYLKSYSPYSHINKNYYPKNWNAINNQ